MNNIQYSLTNFKIYTIVNKSKRFSICENLFILSQKKIRVFVAKQLLDTI